MTQVLASVQDSTIVTVEVDTLSLRFIEDVEYEFVGGGSGAVNED